MTPQDIAGPHVLIASEKAQGYPTATKVNISFLVPLDTC